jgi:hypothetical protein
VFLCGLPGGSASFGGLISMEDGIDPIALVEDGREEFLCFDGSSVYSTKPTVDGGVPKCVKNTHFMPSFSMHDDGLIIWFEIEK